MKRFIVRFFLLIFTLFFGVLLGMQQVNDGLNKMKGFDDQTFGSAFSIQQENNGELQASILGEEISVADIEQKQKKLEEMKAFHFFSYVGKQAATALSSIFQQMVEGLVNLLDKLLYILR